MLALLCLAQFLVVLDTTIVNVALPKIGVDLNIASESGLQYVISLYALTFGGLLIAVGRAADVLGRRRVLIAGVLVFTIASALCGAAPHAAILLSARAVQGVGSALTSAAALALLTTLFADGPARNRALGVWGAVGGAAGACGLIAGGALTDTLGWRSVFFINVPLGLVAVVAAAWLLPSPVAQRGGQSLALPGAATVSAGLGLLVLGLSQHEHIGPAVGMVAGAVALLIVFLMSERRARHPLVPSRLFQVQGVATANVAMLLLTMIVASSLFFTTLYTQQTLRLSPLWTGVAFLPNSALVVVGSTLATRWARTTRPAVLLAVGFALLILAGLLLSGVSPHGTYLTDILPGFAVTGLGQGLTFVAATLGATRGLADADHGIASGLLNSAQQVGFAVGLAALVAAAAALSGPDASPVTNYSTGYLLGAGIAAIGLLVSLALARVHHNTAEPHPTPTA